MFSHFVPGIVTVHWTFFGYSFAFGGGNPFYGSGEYVVMRNVGQAPVPQYGGTIPQLVS